MSDQPPRAPLETRGLAASLDALVVLALPFVLWVVLGLLYAPVGAVFFHGPGEDPDVFVSLLRYGAGSLGSIPSATAGLLLVCASWAVCGTAYLLRYGRSLKRRSVGMRYAGLAPVESDGRRVLALDADLPPQADDMRQPTAEDAAEAPAAPRIRRLCADLLDGVVLLGATPAWLLLFVPLLLPFVELVVILVPLAALTSIAWTLKVAATRGRGVRLASVGQLLTGLVPVAGSRGRRVVRVSDLQRWPRAPRGRVTTGVASLAISAVVATMVIALAGYLVYGLAYTAFRSSAGQQEWEFKAGEAEMAAGAFCAAMIAGGPEAGDDLVVGDAVDALPAYRERVQRAGVVRYETEGSGGSSGGPWSAPEWEFMRREVVRSGPAGAEPTQVSITVREVGGRFRVTGLTAYPAAQP